MPVEDDLFLASAEAALEGAGGDDALATLGWADLLGSLGSDADARQAVFGYFRAQGRRLGSSLALGQLMAVPYAGQLAEGALLNGTATPAGRDGRNTSWCIAAAEPSSASGAARALVLGTPAGGHALAHHPRTGLVLAPLSPASLRALPNDHGLELHALDLTDATPLRLTDGADGEGAHRHSVALGRLALSLEMLGAAETALALAVQHAVDRVQFGRPIGTNQAVRHLLAAARVDVAAIEAVTERAIHLYPLLPDGLDAVSKALAGRNARRACERSLQVLGGIGFTAEHPHHRYHSRVLALDAVLGSSTHLAQQLASELRATGGAAAAHGWLGSVTS